MPTEDEIKRITELRDQGYSLGEIGEKLKKDKSTISRWFKSIGLDCNAVLQRCTTKKATEAKRTYDRERRLALNDLWFEKIEKMLLDAKDSKTLRELATPYGVAEDKRSILEPLQTDHTISGLAEMREAIHEERKNVMEAITEDVQSG